MGESGSAAAVRYRLGLAHAAAGGCGGRRLLVRGGIAALLGALNDVEVVATVSGVEALYVAVEKHKPNVVLTDI